MKTSKELCSNYDWHKTYTLVREKALRGPLPIVKVPGALTSTELQSPLLNSGDYRVRGNIKCNLYICLSNHIDGLEPTVSLANLLRFYFCAGSSPHDIHPLWASWLKSLHFWTPFQNFCEHENATLSRLRTVLLRVSPNSISPCACLSCFVYELLERSFIFLPINSLLNNSWEIQATDFLQFASPHFNLCWKLSLLVLLF